MNTQSLPDDFTFGSSPPLGSFMSATRPSELLRTFPEGEQVVSVVVFRDRVWVATTLNVYYVEGDRLRLVTLEV